MNDKLKAKRRWYLRHKWPEHSDWGRMVVMSAGWAMLIWLVYLIAN